MPGRSVTVRALRALVLSLVPAAAPPLLAQTWTELGHARLATGYQFVGRVSAIAASRTSANLYYCAGADGGVWKTTDAGSSWTPLTDQQATTAIGALALDPANESIIYAGTGEANFANHSRPGQGILRSTDAGATWSLLAQPTFAGRCISRIVINPLATSTLYAGVTRAGGFPATVAAKGHPLANGPRGLFKSTDSGVTWSQLAGGLPALDVTDVAIDPVTPTTLYAAVGFIFGDPANGVYKSTNGGATWAKLAGGLPASPGRIALALAPSNPQRLYTLIANPADASGGSASTLGAFRTDHGGSSWTSLPIGSVQSDYGWYLCTIGVSPTDQNTVFAAGLELYTSSNAGASWSGTGVPHPDCHAIAFDASSRTLVGCDGGLFRRSGTAWSNLNTGLGIIQYYAGLSTHPTDDQVCLAGAQDNGTLRRPANTLGWTQGTGGDGGWTQIDQVNPLVMYAESQGTGSLYKSTNGGTSFLSVGSGLSGRNCFLPPYVIDPNNHNRILYGTERVWESTNAAGSWHALSSDLTGGGTAAIRSLAIAPSDSNYVYAATNDGRVLVSTNSGTTFTPVLLSNPGWPRVTREMFIDPADARTMYLAGAAYGTTQVRRTRDAGATWEALDAGLPDLPVNVVAADTRSPHPRLFAGTDAGLYSSLDEGATWYLYSVAGSGGLPNACVVDIRLETDRSRVVVATQGRGSWLAPVFCPADVDENTFVNGEDFDTFVIAFEAGDPGADFNHDTFVSGDDFDLFITAFVAGC